MSASETGSIRVSSVRFPLLTVEFVGKANDEQFKAYLQGMDAHVQRCLKEGRQSVVLVDTLKATSPVSASQRKLQAEWMAESFERAQQAMGGMVFVIDNMLVRGVLTAILWLQKMPCEHAVFGTRAEAEQWAGARIARESLRPQSQLP